MEGHSLLQLHGHTSFIYKVIALEAQTYASSAEDRTIRIWNGTSLIRRIKSSYP